MDTLARVCSSLDTAGVPYVVIGTMGVNFHASTFGMSIFTEDTDLLLPVEAPSTAAALDALHAEGFTFEAGGEPLVEWAGPVLAGLVRARARVRAARDGVLIDLSMHAQAMDFADVHARALTLDIEEVEVKVAPLLDILRSKLAADRRKDHAFFAFWRSQLAEMMEREGLEPPEGLLD